MPLINNVNRLSNFSRNYSYDSDPGEAPMVELAAGYGKELFGADVPAPPPPPAAASSTLDLRKEMRAQKFLLIITFVYFLCLLPLNVLK